MYYDSYTLSFPLSPSSKKRKKSQFEFSWKAIFNFTILFKRKVYLNDTINEPFQTQSTHCYLRAAQIIQCISFSCVYRYNGEKSE